LATAYQGRNFCKRLHAIDGVEVTCLATDPGKAFGAIVINGLHRPQRAIGVHPGDNRDPAFTAGQHAGCSPRLLRYR
jgi:hypothetical protein